MCNAFKVPLKYSFVRNVFHDSDAALFHDSWSLVNLREIKEKQKYNFGPFFDMVKKNYPHHCMKSFLIRSYSGPYFYPHLD